MTFKQKAETQPRIMWGVRNKSYIEYK